ncbi:streptophobe family protein [Streptacidiphilus sp. PAMC 29251]
MQASDLSTGPRPTRSQRLGLGGWASAAGAVLCALAAMAAVSALGLWLAHATSLPGGAFLPVVAATVLMALGVPVTLDGGAGFLVQANAGIAVLPLSVSLVGALVAAGCFLRPLRLRAVVTTAELLGRAARVAVLWVLALLLLTRLARHSFTLPTGSGVTDQIGGALGVAPTVGFRTGLAATVGFGLLWLLVVLALAFAVSRAAPLPAALLRFQAAVRPTASAVLLVLLAYVALGLVAGVMAAVARRQAGDTFAVVALALPNLVWLAFGIGLGGAWQGHVNAGIGLPMPKALSSVLQTVGTKDVTLDLGTLARYDGRVWLLPVLAAVLLAAGAVLMVVRAPRRVAPWHWALRFGVALALTMLLVGLLTRISAGYGLGLLGVGGSGGLDGLGSLLGGGTGGAAGGGSGAVAGSVFLHADLLRGVLLGALWGALAGLLGGLAGDRFRHGARRAGRGL